MITEDDTWAQLVSLTDIDSSPIPLVKDKYTVGRGIDCDISLSDNKLVSSKHCYIEKDLEGKVWLHDTSTNGTLINLNTKVTKGNKKELQHGDEFYVVYKKDDTERNVGYMYQNMEALQKELDATQEYSSDDIADATLVDDDVNLVESSPERGKKRPADDEVDEKPDSKKQKSEKKESLKKSSSSSEPSKKVTQVKDKADDEKKENTTEGKTTTESKDSSEKEKAQAAEASKRASDEIEEALMCIICQELLHDCISLQPCMHSFCSGCYSEWMERSNECPSCRMKVDRINKNHIVNNLIEAYLKEHPDKKRSDEDLKDLDAKNKITRDMLYPGKKKKDYADSEDSNSSEYDSDEEDRTSTAPAFPAPTFMPPAPLGPQLFGFGTPIFGINRAVTNCRQCPGQNNPGIIQNALNTVKNVLGFGGNAANQPGTATTTGTAVTGTGATGSNADSGTGEDEATLPTDAASPEATTSDEGGPSTSTANPDVKVMPTPPDFTCNPLQNHVLCQCCMQPMPDRRMERNLNPDNVPPQQCSICYRCFCHAYWGCLKADCSGCIGKFKDMNFGKKCLNSLILDNQHESEILKNYIESKNLSVKDVLQECMTKLDAGVYTCTDQGRHTVNSNFVMCYPCALRNFKDLAYLYRYNIAKDQLPEEVTKRPDCYWGKNCRTQRNKPHHAKNFSHICDQTRTTM